MPERKKDAGTAPKGAGEPAKGEERFTESVKLRRSFKQMLQRVALRKGHALGRKYEMGQVIEDLIGDRLQQEDQLSGHSPPEPADRRKR